MRKIGRVHEEIAEEELRGHLARPPRERLIAALSPTARGPHFPRDADDPAQFYERAKRLGLYRG